MSYFPYFRKLGREGGGGGKGAFSMIHGEVRDGGDVTKTGLQLNGAQHRPSQKQISINY